MVEAVETIKRILAIDLGTTRSAGAVYDAMRQPQIVLTREDGAKDPRVTPSVIHICYDAEGKRHVEIGWQAKRAAAADPANVVRLIKRHMCEPEYIWVDSMGKEYTAQELSSLILKKIKQDAEALLGGPVTDVIITVPYYFKDMETRRTREAAVIAGFDEKKISILREPVAAAIGYGLANTGRARRIFVYDFGGGTFDACVLEVDVHGTPKTITATGHQTKGGADIDDAIVNFVCKDFFDKHGVNPQVDENRAILEELLERAEVAKEETCVEAAEAIGKLAEDAGLSAADREAAIERIRESVARQISVNYQGKAHNVSLTYGKLEELARPHIDITMAAVQEALVDAWKARMDITPEAYEAAKENRTKTREIAGAEWNHIDDIILVGGSSKMPLVKRTLCQYVAKSLEATGVTPEKAYAQAEAKFKAGVDPDEIVAIGALLSSSIEERAPETESGSGGGSRVTAFGLGVRAKDPRSGEYVNDIIIPKDTPIPCSRTQYYVLEKDYATSIEITLLQGKERIPELNYRVGTYHISEIPPMKKDEVRVKVTLKYDEEGVVHLSAFAEATKDDASGTVHSEKLGEPLSVKVESSGLLTPEELERIKAEVKELPVS